ncbi:MAG: hypothetical protein IJQ26_00905 [Lachnospiraceae bacterium]|nr:hypothetical protein [Lachnospiraceae bacterium]
MSRPSALTTTESAKTTAPAKTTVQAQPDDPGVSVSAAVSSAEVSQTAAVSAQDTEDAPTVADSSDKQPETVPELSGDATQEASVETVGAEPTKEPASGSRNLLWLLLAIPVAGVIVFLIVRKKGGK